MKRTKKCIAFLAIFALLLGAAGVLASASSHETQTALFRQEAQWNQNGWPDDIGGIYLEADGDTYALLLVDPTPERMEELRARIGGDLAITPARFSLNELKKIKEEIMAGMGPDSMIYAVEIDCKVKGSASPGEIRSGLSGSEVRVIVNADARVFEKYTEEFAQRYGDRVHVIAISGSAYNYWQQQWEQHGYPDDIGGFYSKDGAVWMQVVDPTPERMEELRGLFGEDLRISETKYSFNDLERVRKEIETLMQVPDSLIYSLGAGWTSDESGNVTGFGESGTEFRVVVNVDESMLDHYSAEFARLYGDRVFVEAGSPVVPFARDAAVEATQSQTQFSYAVWILLAAGGVVLLGLPVMVFWLARRRRYGKRGAL